MRVVCHVDLPVFLLSTVWEMVGLIISATELRESLFRQNHCPVSLPGQDHGACPVPWPGPAASWSKLSKHGLIDAASPKGLRTRNITHIERAPPLEWLLLSHKSGLYDFSRW